MLNRILSLIKKIIPAKLFKGLQRPYHFMLAKLAALVYGYPADKMIVVGVTGTSGKSSTCYFIAQILEKAGLEVSMTTTTLFKIAEKEWLNDKKMTMLGRFALQKLLRKMVRAGCEVAVIEATSQGIEQFRHLGINWDILVFTNLYPEHIEAHGGFENYKRAKGKLFEYLIKCKHKKFVETRHGASLHGVVNKKTIIVNLDDEHAEYYLSFKADEKIGFNESGVWGLESRKKIFQIQNSRFKIHLLGDYNLYNVLAALSVAEALAVETDQDLTYLKPLPGRLEFIENNRGIKILIDYAFEPEAIGKLYETLKQVEHKKIIHILGSAGGGRDKSRRPALGRLVAKNADIVIVTNEDPYDENPMEIINQVSAGAEEIRDKRYELGILKILDRRKAIRKALELAGAGDLVLITGKGAEQAICIENSKMIPWDDRQVVREELDKLS